MGDETVSDDDFQNDSVFIRKAAAAEKQQVHQGKAKVCEATGGSESE